MAAAPADYADAFAEVVAAASTDESTAEGLTALLRPLAGVLLEEPLRAVAIDAGLGEALVAILRERALEHAEMAVLACRTLVVLARPFGLPGGAVFKRAGVVESEQLRASARLQVVSAARVVLAVLRRFPSEPAVQAAGCWALVNITLDADACAEFWTADGPAYIIDRIMGTHRDSVEVMHRATHALVNIFVPFVGLDVPEALVCVLVWNLRRFPEHADLQTRTLLVLRNITCKGKDGGRRSDAARLCRQLVLIGVPALLDAVRAEHPGNDFIRKAVRQLQQRIVEAEAGAGAQ